MRPLRKADVFIVAESTGGLVAWARSFERILQDLAKALILLTSVAAAYTLWRGTSPWTVATIWLVFNALTAIARIQYRPKAALRRPRLLTRSDAAEGDRLEQGSERTVRDVRRRGR